MRQTATKIRLIGLGAAMLLGGCIRVIEPAPVYPVPPPQAPAAVDDSAPVNDETFVQTLSPYGEWLFVAGVGRVWRPYQQVVGVGFVPYVTGGRWLYTDSGWVFSSGWDWGWAVYHYGHWYQDPFYGWIWVPGHQWAPAWVEWRLGGGFVGWYPSPPPRLHVVIAPERFVVVEARHLASPAYVDRYVLPPGAHPATAVLNERPPERYGPPREYIEHHGGPPLAPAHYAPPRPGHIERAEGDRPAPPPGRHEGSEERPPPPPGGHGEGGHAEPPPPGPSHPSQPPPGHGNGHGGGKPPPPPGGHGRHGAHQHH